MLSGTLIGWNYLLAFLAFRSKRVAQLLSQCRLKSLTAGKECTAMLPDFSEPQGSSFHARAYKTGATGSASVLVAISLCLLGQYGFQQVKISRKLPQSWSEYATHRVACNEHWQSQWHPKQTSN